MSNTRYPAIIFIMAIILFLALPAFYYTHLHETVASHFNFEKFLNSKGRKIIGRDNGNQSLKLEYESPEISRRTIHAGSYFIKGSSNNFNILCGLCVFFAFSALNFYKR